MGAFAVWYLLVVPPSMWYLLWHSLLHGLQGNACSAVDFSLGHRGISVAPSLCSSLTLLLCSAVPHLFCVLLFLLPSLLCHLFALKHFSPEVLPADGLNCGCAGAIVETGGAGWTQVELPVPGREQPPASLSSPLPQPQPENHGRSRHSISDNVRQRFISMTVTFSPCTQSWERSGFGLRLFPPALPLCTRTAPAAARRSPTPPAAAMARRRISAIPGGVSDHAVSRATTAAPRNQAGRLFSTERAR